MWANRFIVIFCLSVDSQRRIFFVLSIHEKYPAENGQRKQWVRHLQRVEAHPAFSPPRRRKRRISFDLGGIFAYRLFRIFEP
jgi:hypothetical protein